MGNKYTINQWKNGYLKKVKKIDIVYPKQTKRRGKTQISEIRDEKMISQQTPTKFRRSLENICRFIVSQTERSKGLRKACKLTKDSKS
jgi:hypothetical protein